MYALMMMVSGNWKQRSARLLLHYRQQPLHLSPTPIAARTAKVARKRRRRKRRSSLLEYLFKRICVEVLPAIAV